ncbi:MAG: hypothetical protein GF417_13785 [Candidatus Latescibacteria bacterium]|nr:hypothetical protein [bacterium]MBD3425501.1 hypothetical protein [Candidatus Latescibacterota bacterium]
MEGRVDLWVKLKVADLVVETAWFTLTEKLDFTGSLFGLSRYSCWFIRASGPDMEIILDELDGTVTLDSAFFNQNKHRYSLVAAGPEGTKIPGRRGDFEHENDFVLRDSTPDGNRLSQRPDFSLYACDCLITTGGAGADYAGRLRSRVERISISQVESGEVWRVILKADSREEALELVECIAVTRSRREGLLLNPHYQSHRILGIEEIPGRRE